MRIIKRPKVTLLELMVAMALLSFLLVLIFGFFRDLSKVDEWANFQQQKSFERRYLEYRLGYIFANLVNENDINRGKAIFLIDPLQKSQEFSKFPSLIFKYDNGPRSDPDFSGDLLGRLYVDLEGSLCLASWPIKTQNVHAHMKKEVLIENVENLKFEVFKTPMQVDPNQHTAGVWLDEWLDKEKMPGILKIHLTLQEKKDPLHKLAAPQKNLVLEFPLPKQAKEAIYYRKTG